MTRALYNIASAVFLLFLVQAVQCKPRKRSYRCNGTTMVCFDDKDRPFQCAKKRFVCCRDENGDGVIRKVQRNHMCCSGSLGGQLFNHVTQVCDERRVRAKEDSEQMCGAKVFDSQTSVCCIFNNQSSGNVYLKVPGGSCCNGDYLSDSSIGCCVDTAYSKKENICCQTEGPLPKLHEIRDGACCLDAAYDTTTHECDSNMRVIPKASEPCGENEWYNPQTHICCGEEIYSSNFICYGGVDPVRKMHPNHDGVCEVTDSEGDPGYETYDTSERACIPGDRTVVLEQDQAICGLFSTPMVYNTTSDLCCGGEVHEGQRGRGKKCCQGGDAFYDPLTESCCGNVVQEWIAENEGGRCCFDELYDSSTHDCDAEESVVRNCEPSLQKLEKLKKKGIYVYKATFDSIESSKDTSTVWSLTYTEQLKGKNKLKFNKVKNLQIKTDSSECFQSPKIGSAYFVITNKKLKSSPAKDKYKRGKLVKRKVFNYIFPLDTDLDTVLL